MSVSTKCQCGEVIVEQDENAPPAPCPKCGRSPQAFENASLPADTKWRSQVPPRASSHMATVNNTAKQFVAAAKPVLKSAFQKTAAASQQAAAWSKPRGQAAAAALRRWTVAAYRWLEPRVKAAGIRVRSKFQELTSPESKESLRKFWARAKEDPRRAVGEAIRVREVRVTLGVVAAFLMLVLLIWRPWAGEVNSDEAVASSGSHVDPSPPPGEVPSKAKAEAMQALQDPLREDVWPEEMGLADTVAKLATEAREASGDGRRGLLVPKIVGQRMTAVEVLSGKKWSGRPEQIGMLLDERIESNASGIVTALNLNGSTQTDANLAKLAQFNGLERIWFGDAKLAEDATLEVLVKLTALKIIDMGEAEIGDETVANIAAVPNLESLRIHSPALSDRGLASVGRARNLVSLSIDSIRMTNDGVRNLGGLKNLKVLHLAGARLTSGCVKHLAGLTRLERFTLPVDPREWLAMLPVLSRFTHVAELQWIVPQHGLYQGKPHLPTSSSPLRVEGAQLLTALAEHKGLKDLDLSIADVEDKDLATLNAFANLESLSLANCPINGTELGRVASLPRLRTLSLAGTHVSDADIQVLAESNTLRSVDLNLTHVTTTGIRSLEDKAPRLRVEFGESRGMIGYPRENSRRYVMSQGNAYCCAQCKSVIAERFLDDSQDEVGFVSRRIAHCEELLAKLPDDGSPETVKGRVDLTFEIDELKYVQRTFRNFGIIK